MWTGVNLKHGNYRSEWIILTCQFVLKYTTSITPLFLAVKYGGENCLRLKIFDAIIISTFCKRQFILLLFEEHFTISVKLKPNDWTQTSGIFNICFHLIRRELFSKQFTLSLYIYSEKICSSIITAHSFLNEFVFPYLNHFSGSKDVSSESCGGWEDVCERTPQMAFLPKTAPCSLL